MNGGIIRVTWIVLAVLSLLTDCGLSALSIEFGGSTSTDAISFGVLPLVFSDNTSNELTVTAWIRATDLTTEPVEIFNFSTNGGGLRFSINNSPSGSLVVYSNIFNVAPGAWASTGTVSINTWTFVAYTFNFSSTANDPLIYINNTSQTITEVLTPAGSAFPRSNVPIVIGNRKSATEDYDRPFPGKIYDSRVYHRILTQTEITTLYNGGTPDETLLTDPSTGLVFQAFAVRTGELADYVDDTLTSTMLVRDAVFGAVGVPHGSPIGRAAP